MKITNRRTVKRLKTIAVVTVGFACTCGFTVLLVQPKELNKALMLGAGVGLSMSIFSTSED